jgi:hypothetical protein
MSNVMHRIRARLTRREPVKAETATTGLHTGWSAPEDPEVGPMMPLVVVTFFQAAFFHNSGKPPDAPVIRPSHANCPRPPSVAWAAKLGEDRRARIKPYQFDRNRARRVANR